MSERNDDRPHQDADPDKRTPKDQNGREEDVPHPDEPEADNEVEEATIATTDPENAPD